MWVLDNQTPFCAERTWVRDRNGGEVWIVAIKGTFELSAFGKLSLSNNQIPVTLAPVFRDPDSTELLYDTDVPECKVATDVIVNGTACAPQGQACAQWQVNLRVGPIDKTLHISGPRHWKKKLGGYTLSASEPIDKIPLSYRYAFGGADSLHHTMYASNPIGCGFTQEYSDCENIPAPSIEYPSGLISSLRDRPVPAGLTTVPTSWQPRLAYAGTYDSAWELERFPLVPEDFNPLFYQCTPRDQQVPGFLKGGELVEITHLSPIEHLQFRLPRAAFLLRTFFTGGQVETHRANIHTLIIEPDDHRVILVWHSRLPCHQDIHRLEKTVIQLKQRIFEKDYHSGIKFPSLGAQYV